MSSKPSATAGAGISPSRLSGGGTAGLYARDTAGKKYVVASAHVIIKAQTTDRTVYSPEVSTCCSVDCNSPIGSVIGTPARTTTPLGSTTFAVDAVLIELVPDAQVSNVVPEIGLIQGVRNLASEVTPDAALDLPVEMYGAVSKHTYGRARRWVQAEWGGWLLAIDAVVAPGKSAPSKTYALDMATSQANTADVDLASPETFAEAINASGVLTAVIGGTAKAPTITITGPTFSAEGDSGAPIVDSSRNLVGFVQGSSYKRFYKNATDYVDIDFYTKAVVGQTALAALGVQIAPATPSAGAPIIVPGAALSAVFDRHAVVRARTRLEATPSGARLAAVAAAHAAEIRHLIHHRRRVTVTWHRNKGPAYVAALLRSSRDPGWPIPTAIDGIALAQTIRAMRDVLIAEGSEELAATLARESTALDAASRVASVDHALTLLGSLP